MTLMQKKTKKIAITGHTKSLGKSLFDSLAIKHQVAGFSRSNGFDIKVMRQIVRLRKMSEDDRGEMEEVLTIYKHALEM